MDGDVELLRRSKKMELYTRSMEYVRDGACDEMAR